MGLDATPEILPIAQRSWRQISGDQEIWDDAEPDRPRFVQPNRHCTMLFYINNVVEGGETVFPKAVTSQAPRIHRPGMPDCSRGLSVSPHAYAAALFYHKHGDGTNDPRSAHGGCPPVRGEKWAINSFMWNVPFHEG